MRELSIKEHKQYALNILIAIDEFCRKYQIKYFLAYGTLIGAIRHKGFIPWDDDIDIWMPRPDYDKFLKTFQDEKNRYVAISPFAKNARHSFLKVVDTKTIKIEKNVNYENGFLGIDVDVFPLDGQPDNEKEYIKWYKKLHKTYRKFLANILDLKMVSRKARWYYRMIKICNPRNEELLTRAEKLHELYAYQSANLVGSKSSLYENTKDRFPKDWFDQSISVEFEGHSLMAPKEYDKILNKLYGAYMIPPEKQQTHHNNKVFALDNE